MPTKIIQLLIKYLIFALQSPKNLGVIMKNLIYILLILFPIYGIGQRDYGLKIVTQLNLPNALSDNLMSQIWYNISIGSMPQKGD